jgi:FtsH-binding integral membrane protein
MNQENFSAQDSLQVIQSMIEKAKNQFSENGHLYLLWGWVVFFCSIAQFILLKYVQYEKHYYVWMVCWLAVIYQLFYLRRQHKGQRVKTYADNMMGFIWISFFILMMLVGISFGQLGKEHYYKLISPVFLAMYGVPTFLCGIFLRFRPLVIGGIGCWVLSVIAHFIPYDYQLLLLSAAMIIAWIIPGYILQKKYQQQKT